MVEIGREPQHPGFVPPTAGQDNTGVSATPQEPVRVDLPGPPAGRQRRSASILKPSCRAAHHPTLRPEVAT